MLFLILSIVSHLSFAGYFHCETLFLNQYPQREIVYGGSTVYVFTKPNVFRIVHLKNDFYFRAEINEQGEVFVEEYLSDTQAGTRSGLHLPKVYDQMTDYFGKENIKKIILVNAQAPVPDFLQVDGY